VFGGPCGIRTHDSRIKSQSLCRGAFGSDRRFEIRRLDRLGRPVSCRVQCLCSAVLRSTGFDVPIAGPLFRCFNDGSAVSDSLSRPTTREASTPTAHVQELAVWAELE